MAAKFEVLRHWTKLRRRAQKALANALVVLAVTMATNFTASAAPIESAPSPPVQVRGLGNSQIDMQNGAFAQDVAIEAPAFHEITPHLSLHYSSSAGDGFAGVGWDVSGFSMIQREYFQGQWRYVLDGEPLMSTGGVYKTIRQPFDRISFSGSTWTLTKPNGVVYTYSGLYRATTGGAYGYTRWGLSSVQDPHLNTATYTWTCKTASTSADTLQCYPYQVRYADVLITFAIDPNHRPTSDQPTFATGSQVLGQMSERLGSVTVTVSSQTFRKYQLAYTTSARSGRSLLQTVTTSGASITLPTTTYTWYDTANSFARSDLTNAPGIPSTAWYNATTYPGDFNGDGHDDLFVRGADQKVYFLPGQAGGGYGYATDISNQVGAAGILGPSNSMLPYSSFYFGDFNGDGTTDLLVLSPDGSPIGQGQCPNYRAYLLTSNVNAAGGSLFNYPVNVTPYLGLYESQLSCGRIIVGDFNGDGRADLFFPDLNNSPNTTIVNWAGVALADGTNFGQVVPIHDQTNMPAGDWQYAQITPVDFNSDGHSGLLVHVIYPIADPSNTNRVVIFPEFVPNSGYPLFNGYAIDVTNSFGMNQNIWQYADLIPGDFNGDGKVDLLVKQQWNSITGPSAVLLYGNANGDTNYNYTYADVTFSEKIDITNANGMTDDRWRGADVFTGDFNGDGKTDLLVRRAKYPQSYPTLMLTSNGNGFDAPTDITNLNNVMSWDKWQGALRVGDVNGDGVDDIVVQSENASGGPARSLLLSASAPGNVITGAANGYGGTTTIGYVPSTTWINKNNPPKMQTVTTLAVADGRSGDKVQTTNYSYSVGAWDPIERRVLGFGYVKSSNPNDPTLAYDESFFYQGPAYQMGELQEHRLKYPGSVTPLVDTVRILPTPTTAPWVETLSEQDDTECDVSCKKTIKSYSYDSYGDVTVLDDQGDSATGSDDRTTTFSLTTWGNIVNLPTDVAVHQGNAGGALLKEMTFGNFTSGGDPQTIQSRLINSTENRLISTTALYDHFGNKTSETDALNHTTTTLWDPYGRMPTQTTNAAQQITKYNPNMACSGQVTITDPNQQVTQWTYDGFCRKQTETRPDLGTTTYGYNLYGNPSAQYNSTVTSDGLNHTLSTTSYFDGLGREYKNQNNAGDTVSTTYDVRGLVASVTAPNGPATNYAYDARKRLVTTTFPGPVGHSTQTSTYDAWWTTTCDEEGKARTVQRDAYGEIRLVEEYLGATTACAAGPTTYVTKIDYDLLGDQTGYTTYTDGTMKYVATSGSTAFDSLGRVTSRNDPDMGTWTYGYDDANRMTSRTDAKGQTITSTYDALNRLLSTSNNIDSSGTSFVYDSTFNHYGVGRLASSSRMPTGNYEVSDYYDYDKMGHVTSDQMMISGDSYTTTSSYDSMGNLSTHKYPNNEVLTYTYDYVATPSLARGLPYSLKSSAFTTPIVQSAAYDPRRNPTTRKLGNGVLESFTYDPYRFWLTGVSASLGTAQVHGVTLVRDGRGLVKTRTNARDPTDVWTYSYDDVRRLTQATDNGNSAWSEAFRYDMLNRVTYSSLLGTYNYPAFGSPQIHAPVSIFPSTNWTTSNTYDANGNLLRSGKITFFSYNVENLPTSVNGQGTGYNAAGVRVYQADVDFADGGNYEFATSGVATRYYYFGGVRVASAQGTALTFYHGDQLNSATTLTNGSGAVISRQVLSPLGRRLAYTATSTDRIALAGVRLDTTGLYTMGARDMHPGLGIFITPDPSGAPDPERPQTLNRYAYANNSPTNLVDLTGFQAAEPDAIASSWAYQINSIMGINSHSEDPAAAAIAPRVESETRAALATEIRGAESDASEAETVLGVASLFVPGAEEIGVDVLAGRAVIASRSASELLPSVGTLVEETEGLVAKGKTFVAQITKNREAGNAFRDELAEQLRLAGREVEKEVYKKTPFGKRFIDIQVSQNGRVLGGVETKLNSSRYYPLQQLKDWWLKNAEGYPVNVARGTSGE